MTVVDMPLGKMWATPFRVRVVLTALFSQLPQEIVEPRHI